MGKEVKYICDKCGYESKRDTDFVSYKGGEHSDREYFFCKSKEETIWYDEERVPNNCHSKFLNWLYGVM